MYHQPFYITRNVGNNVFSFDKRENKKLYVPSLKKISSFDEIEFGDEVVFEDYNIYNDTQLDSCKGIKNFYEIDWQGKKIYLFDNHNHAYYFWYLARDKGYIRDEAKLYHVDEHSDMRDVEVYPVKPDSLDMEKIFQATNFSDINVGNYILPAQKEGLIGEIIQIRNEENLREYLNPPPSLPLAGEGSNSPLQGGDAGKAEGGVILNLDLDFFQPDLDFIDYDLKKQVVLDAAQKANVITVATSPFFIEQELAIKVFKDLFQ